VESRVSTFSFVIHTEPRPKKRPKVYRWATVNPSKKDEEDVRILFKKIKTKPKKPLSQQIRVQFKFYVTPPKSTPQWKYEYIENGYLRPNKSPDLDNYVKLILDALNGLLWEDDRFIVEIHSGKYYTLDRPRTEIFVSELPIPEKRSDIAVFDDFSKYDNVGKFFAVENQSTMEV